MTSPPTPLLAVTLSIDGRERPPGDLWRPEMSLSSARAGRLSATYVLAIGRAPLFAAIAGAYERWVRESRDDDALTSGGEGDALGRAGYPPLDALAQHPQALAEVVGSYLEEDVFAAVLPPASGAMRGTWAIDTVDEVRLDGERVILRGTCYAF
ncbi:MAG TPA: hypothetical protein VFJ16_29915 [Longimicrobium sp.]|nr:hypothetical protein [Longimicrobium sp.]